jgi:nucleotide-binding universal stress UspA family protein
MAIQPTIRVLVGYDGRSSSRDSLALAALLRQAEDVELVLGVVVPRRSPGGEFHAHEEALGRESTDLFAQASTQLDELDSAIHAERRAIGGEFPAEGLGDLARSEGADLIVIGSTNRGPIGRIVPGTTADGLIAHAPCAFAVAPRGYAERPDRDLRIVGLAYDGSTEAKRAATVAIGLARRAACGLRAFGVHEPLASAAVVGGPVPLDNHMLGEAIERELGELIESLPPSVGGQHAVLSGRAAHALLDQSWRAVDLMVFGTRGFGRFLQLLGGSVTSEVVRAAPWPVLVVPPAGSLPFASGSDDAEALVADPGKSTGASEVSGSK